MACAVIFSPLSVFHDDISRIPIHYHSPMPVSVNFSAVAIGEEELPVHCCFLPLVPLPAFSVVIDLTVILYTEKERATIHLTCNYGVNFRGITEYLHWIIRLLGYSPVRKIPVGLLLSGLTSYAVPVEFHEESYL